MALSLFEFKNSSNDAHIYGVLKVGVTQEQIIGILQSDTSSMYSSLLDLLDDSYDLDFVQFCTLEQSIDFGIGYEVDFDYDTISIYSVNNGLGGIAEEDRNDTNTSIVSYSISNYKVSSALYASADFRPNTFLTGVVRPVSDWALNSAIPLAFLAVTFFVLGVRILRRVARSLGRGR